MSFSENLRDALELANLGQTDLAKETGINIKSIENYVKKDSKTIPSAYKAVKMARVLGITVEDFFKDSEKKKGENSYQNRNSKIIAILEKLDKYNFEVINSMAKALLDFQVKKTIQKQQ